MIKKTVLLLLFFITVPGCTGKPAKGTLQKVTFKTQDGWTLAADYSGPVKGVSRAAVIMFHGLGSGKNEWKLLTERLGLAGMEYLAVDLRGHGESNNSPKGKRDFRSFIRKEDWAGVVNDVFASVRFLKKKGLRENQIILVGASIGANLVLKASVSGSIKPKAIVLLSPGLNYQGITTAHAIKKTGTMPVLIAAAPVDEYAYESSLILMQISQSAKEADISFIKAAEGHGVNMFEGEKNKSAKVFEKIFDWIENSLKPL